MKLLKRKILFVLASEFNFFKPTEIFNYYPYSFLYWRLNNYRPSSIRGAILELNRAGEVDKIIRNKTSLSRITSRGRDRLLSFFPISIGQKRVWDRRWRIAIVKARPLHKALNSKLVRKLRRGLKKLGFKKLSRGIYLTPLPVTRELKDFLFQANLTPQLSAVIESRNLVVGDNQRLARQIWPLDSLSQNYLQLITKMKRLLMILKKKKVLSNKEKTSFSLILNNFFSLLEADPGLPKKLLPADWPLNSAYERFLQLAERIKIKENNKN